MATGNEMNAYAQHAMHVMAEVYHAATRDGTLEGMAREALKDVRSTLFEVFFGRGEHGGEPGAPLNPLYYDIVRGRNEHAAALGDGHGGPTPPVSLPQGTAQSADFCEGGGSPGLVEMAVKVGSHAVQDLVSHSIHGQATPPATAGQIPSGEDRSVHGPQQEQVNVHGPAADQGREIYGPPIAPSPQPAAPTAGDIIRDEDRALYGQDAAQAGQIMTQDKSFVQDEMARRAAKAKGDAESDQNERLKARILPQEQREQQKDNDRGGQSR